MEVKVQEMKPGSSVIHFLKIHPASGGFFGSAQSYL